MNIINKLRNNEFTDVELLEYLDSRNPILLYEVMRCIVNNHITNEVITNKLIQLSKLLGEEHKMLGYYKLGHVAMATLLKIGYDEKIIFGNDLDNFDRETAIKFSKNAW